MKNLLFAAILLITSCNYHGKMDILPQEKSVNGSQQMALSAILAALNVSGPHELISVAYFKDSLHLYANVTFKHTLTNLGKNIILQKPVMLEEPGKTYVCLGNCPCYVNAVLEPDGTWGAKCTCTDCVLTVFNSIEETDAFFN